LRLRVISLRPIAVCRMAPTWPPSRVISGSTCGMPGASGGGVGPLRMPRDWDSSAMAESISRQISAWAAGLEAISGLDSRCCNSYSFEYTAATVSEQAARRLIKTLEGQPPRVVTHLYSVEGFVAALHGSAHGPQPRGEWELQLAIYCNEYTKVKRRYVKEVRRNSSR
jgi:hypothetical protein